MCGYVRNFFPNKRIMLTNLFCEATDGNQPIEETIKLLINNCICNEVDLVISWTDSHWSFDTWFILDFFGQVKSIIGDFYFFFHWVKMQLILCYVLCHTYVIIDSEVDLIKKIVSETQIWRSATPARTFGTFFLLIIAIFRVYRALTEIGKEIFSRLFAQSDILFSSCTDVTHT